MVLLGGNRRFFFFTAVVRVKLMKEGRSLGNVTQNQKNRSKFKLRLFCTLENRLGLAFPNIPSLN